ncbi:Hsp70 family protein [Streptomyces sp. NBC_00648]|uniref:Hsp70 family protein n=1 Tax=Streptomyces sp. NBC_00648 TaxID=2975797 RepID=UPI003246760C
MGQAIGIDLGTTYSAVAVANDALPTILRNREGENITPSVVMIQGGTAVVGSQAKRSALSSPDSVVQFVKRKMGEKEVVLVDDQGKQYRAEEISAAILRRLKEDAEMVLGESVDSAVITVPAYFDDARRVATKDAGRMAGLNVLRIINEPTAAALAYGATHPDGGNLGTVMVFDLGGGTFDVTIMRISGGAFDVLATRGDRNLGGFDWDNALMMHLNEQYRARRGEDLTDDDFLSADLRDKAELAKRTLSLATQAVVMLTKENRTEQIKITRQEFEELTAKLLLKTERIAEAVLESAKLTWPDIDEVLLVGGSTRMPMVSDLLERRWGRRPSAGVNQDEAVALGAALMAFDEQTRAAQVSETGSTRSVDVTEQESGSALATLTKGRVNRIRDVTSQSLGTVVQDEFSKQMKNRIIIAHDTPLPAKEQGTFATVSDRQREIELQVTEGEDEDLQYVRIIGSSDIRVPPYPAGAPVEVTYSYDRDAILHVEVKDLTSGKQLGEFEINRTSNLDEGEIRRMTAELRQTGIS